MPGTLELCPRKGHVAVRTLWATAISAPGKWIYWPPSLRCTVPSHVFRTQCHEAPSDLGGARGTPWRLNAPIRTCRLRGRPPWCAHVPPPLGPRGAPNAVTSRRSRSRGWRQCHTERLLLWTKRRRNGWLREARYKDMRMKNNAICQDITRRAQMARWRAAHPGYMAAAAREHKQRRAQKLHAQREQETQSHLETTPDGTV